MRLTRTWRDLRGRVAGGVRRPRRAALLVGCVLAFALGIALAGRAGADDLQPTDAQAFFDRYVALGERYDPRLADLYTDDARIRSTRRYPNGAAGEFFFMKRAPSPRPDWIEICEIDHGSKGVIPFPMIQDLPSLLWVINLGCIDLNQWYARCDDVDRPDYLHFDLDPVKGRKPVPFERVREAALVVRDGLQGLGMPCYAKTTGSRGIHVYVPIVRGPTQKDVWTLAKNVSVSLARLRPQLQG